MRLYRAISGRGFPGGAARSRRASRGGRGPTASRPDGSIREEPIVVDLGPGALDRGREAFRARRRPVCGLFFPSRAAVSAAPDPASPGAASAPHMLFSLESTTGAVVRTLRIH